MTGTVVGIDPGNSGALALLSIAGELLEILDMPCIADGVKGRRTVNPALLASIVRRWAPRAAYVELIGARPTDAKVAAFSFGRCRGAIAGVCGSLAVPITMLAVPSWRRAVGLPAGASKELARGEAVRRWPGKADLFARKKDDGRPYPPAVGSRLFGALAAPRRLPRQHPRA
jgi:crossover junction endodeoxyribonuclease RuvC